MIETVPLGELLESRARFLLSFPHYNADRAGMILDELREAGVESLVLRGRHEVDRVPIMGKGHTGIVVQGLVGEELVAVKILRVDADRESLDAEARCLGVANRVGVGPRLHGVAPHLIVMELVEGDYLVRWVKGLDREDEALLRGVLIALLEKAHRLDEVGLDHGELSTAHRHVIVSGGEPRIIDFESASTGRRVANVTSIAQYLFFNRNMKESLGRVIPLPDEDSLIEALSAYKRDPSREGLRAVLGVSGLVA